MKISESAILVTGGAGYIGSHMVLALRAAGFAVVVIDDLSTGRRQLVGEDVVFIKGDIGDADLVGQVIRKHDCQAVFHFAGSIINPQSFDIPLDYYANNTCASRTLLQTCVGAGVDYFIFSSSAAVYGEPDSLPIAESAPTRPTSPYGRSKLMTEWMLEDAARVSDMKFAALRYFNVAGADADGRSGQVGPPTHLIKIATETALGRRDAMSILGDDYDTPDGTCIRDYIHITDLVNAHIMALDHLVEGNGSIIMNCGYGHGYSVREVIEAVEKVVGKKLDAGIGPRRQGDATALVADNSNILSTLAWRPEHDSLDEIIKSALAWEIMMRDAPLTER